MVFHASERGQTQYTGDDAEGGKGKRGRETRRKLVFRLAFCLLLLSPLSLSLGQLLFSRTRLGSRVYTTRARQSPDGE